MGNSFPYQDERFADIQMLRYRLSGFEKLSLSQKLYAYHLAEAALAGRDIITDQHGRHNILIRKVLEIVFQNFDGDRSSDDFMALTTYLKQVWFANGIYHHYSRDKFQPAFSEKFLSDAINSVSSIIEERIGKSVEEICEEIFPVMFDRSVEPKLVNLADGEDLIKTSAVNFYEGVSQKEVEEYYAQENSLPQSPLNSKLVRTDSGLGEQVWKIGGMYGDVLNVIVGHLEKACSYAENEQQRNVISLLIDYYRTGDLNIFDRYSIEWIKEQQGDIDFINGFIEVYSDPLGLKGSWEGLVEYVDKDATQRTKLICDNAQWFENHSPMDEGFKKDAVVGVSARVINAAMLGGDEYPASAIGINLPNAEWIREQYGSKSITIGNLIEAYDNAARGNGFYEEFIADEDTLALVKTYSDLCDKVHTDLHECVGHGSGKVLDGVSVSSLKSYYNTIEEARADLFGLYFVADEKLVEWGILPDAEAYKSQYYTYLLNGLMTQLVRLKPGDQLEEAHMRNRAMISRWVLDNSKGVISLEKKGEKTYLVVNDYVGLRRLFGELLREIQRVKSEGDFEAARQLVEQYGVKVDVNLHSEVRKRYEKLNLAPYKGFINPRMLLIRDEKDEISDVEIDYTEIYTDQMLRYSKEYGVL